MNTVELYREIKRLQTLRLKNEAVLSKEELEGKYKSSYEKLCGNIKHVQKEYQAECTRVIRVLTEIIADLAYFEPTDEGYDAIRDEIVDRSKGCKEDPLLIGLVGTVIEKFECKE